MYTTHKIILIVTFILFDYTSLLFGQCLDENFAFKSGERLHYEVYYNWGFIWLNAGEAEFDVKTDTFKNKPVYFLDSYGSSYRGYDWIYKVRDSYRTYLDMKTLQPLWFHRNTYEGGYTVNNSYLFDQLNRRIISSSENSKKPLVKDTLKMKNCTYDVLSLIYLSRNLSFKDVKVNDTIPVTAVIDNEVYPLYIRYLGKDIMETRDGHKYKCIKFSALLVEGTMFRGGEDLFVWITDDQNRIPVLVEAKILVGSVKAMLAGSSGLRNPVTSKIE